SYPMDNSTLKLWLNDVDVAAKATVTPASNPTGVVVTYANPILLPGTNTVELRSPGAPSRARCSLGSRIRRWSSSALDSGWSSTMIQSTPKSRSWAIQSRFSGTKRFRLHSLLSDFPHSSWSCARGGPLATMQIRELLHRQPNQLGAVNGG